MLKVIGSGFWRTGTLSMKAALEQLGFDPCYHMAEVLVSPKHIAAWHKVAHGQSMDWHELMKDYQATVDFPACLYYRELMEAFPDAKVIHNVRDPEKWHQSTYDTVYQFPEIAPKWVQRLIKPLGQIIDTANVILFQGLFDGKFEDRRHAIEIFHQHTENVKRAVPPERLLIFDVKEGWEPLCKFLNVPVPDTPFPHVNDSETMKRRLKWLHRLFHWGPIVFGALLLVGIVAVAK